MSHPGPPRTPQLRVLAVCTGNLCRSPTAEQLFRARLDPQGTTLVFRSAGTMASNGEPMIDAAAQWSRRMGGDPTRHAALYLSRRVLDPVDLAIGMAREHRRAIVDLRPGLTRATFTLLEFARLAAAVTDAELDAAISRVVVPADPRERLQALLALLARARSRTLPVDLTTDDVTDPIGGPPDRFALSAMQIDLAVDQAVRVLRRTIPGGAIDR